jgi:hypothetical protein
MANATTLERGTGGSAVHDGAGPLGAIVFGLLVVACFGAFFITQRLKHTPTPVQKITMYNAFSPTPFGRHKQERLSFRIAKADDVTLAVVNDTTNAVVAMLLRDRPIGRYHQFRLAWNGRTGLFARGPLAPQGDYRLRFFLRGQNRTVYSPRTFRLVTTRPQPGH